MAGQLSELAQMRHLDLLAAYFAAAGGGEDDEAEERYLHRMSRDALIAAVLAQKTSHTPAAEVHPQ